MNIENSYTIYGFRHIITDKVYIGLQRPGKSFYISSSENQEFWRDYQSGMLQKSILFTISKYERESEKLCEAAEWFGLNHAFAVLGKDKMYNYQNNAHSTHENLLTVDHKKVIVDWINKKSDGIVISNSRENENKRVLDIVERINESKFDVSYVSMNELASYDYNQIRVEKYIRSHVNEIAQRLEENPEDVKNKLTPIVAVISVKVVDGKPVKVIMILDGNNRKLALEKVRGISEAPVIFINETEFGETEQIRKKNYQLFGLIMNKEDDVVRQTNSNADIKRNIDILLSTEDLDLTKPIHVDRARKLVEDYFLGTVIPTKKKLSGIWKSFMTDFEHGEAEKYRDNMNIYNDSYLETYTFNNYSLKDIAVIHASMSKTEYAQAFAYVCRRMKNLKSKKGAIVLHYATPQEYQKYKNESWLRDLKETIEHSGLDISVDVLPAFGS